MSDILAVFKISWEQGLAYRLNFFLWRVRTVLQLLLVYFIWWTVFQSQDRAFGYTEGSILTYILIITIIRAVVLSSRANDIMNKINDGSIVNFLVKPISIIKYYLAQDIADKLLNTLFMIFEVALILYILKPEIIIQSNLLYIGLFVLSIFLALNLWFCINMIIGMMAFWVENSWGPLFLIMIFLEGMGGGLFPIDILPKIIFDALMLTPFPYLIYFPAKVYLGAFSINQLSFYFSINIFWVVISIFLTRLVLAKGLKQYTTVGN